MVGLGAENVNPWEGENREIQIVDAADNSYKTKGRFFFQYFAAFVTVQLNYFMVDRDVRSKRRRWSLTLLLIWGYCKFFSSKVE